MKTPVVRPFAIPRTRPEQFEEYPGDIISPLPAGDYLQVQLLGHSHTANEACFDVWNAINGEAQKLSAQGFAQTPVTGMDLVGNVVDAINRIFGVVNSRVVTLSNSMFSSTFGGPLPYSFEHWPIRWPAEAPDALKWVLKFVESAFQVPQVRSNMADWGVVSDHASIIMRPLYLLKANIMRTQFGMEVKGDISPSELDAIFRDSNLKPPLGSSFDDQHDTLENLAAEDAAAATDESAAVPTRETLDAMSQGQEVWTFVPSSQNWTTFGELKRRQEKDAPNQVPLAPFPFSPTNPISGSGSAGAGSASAGGSATTESPSQ